MKPLNERPMEYRWHLCLAYRGLAGCTFSPAAAVRQISPPASSSAMAPRKTATPEQALRHYLECWRRSDYHGMWQQLSKETRKSFSLLHFKKNMENSTKNYLKVTRILSVRRLPEKSGKSTPTTPTAPTVAYVEYQVEARITQKEADHLRKGKYPEAKPGLWVFHPHPYKMVFENGAWFIDRP